MGGSRSGSRSRSGKRSRSRSRRRSRSGKRDDRRRRDRSRSRGRRGDDGPPQSRQIRIGVQAGPRGDIVYKEDIDGFLRQWADDVGKIETGVSPLEADEPGWQFILVDIQSLGTRARILDWFNSPRGRRYLVLREMAVKVQEWPLKRLQEDDREAEAIPWKWRKGAAAMLSEEYPEEKVLALDSAEGRRYFFLSADIHRTEGAASFIEQKRKDGSTAKRTVCHHWRRDAHCRFGSECAYIHIKAGSGREDAGAGPNANSMLGVRGSKFPLPPPGILSSGSAGGGGGMGGGRPPPMNMPPPPFPMPPGMPGMPGGAGGGFPGLPGIPDDDDDLSSSEDEPAPAKKARASAEHFEDTLIVRDVDKDTDARGIRRMTEGDFTRMWCDIDGYRKASLFREDGGGTKYGGSYGLVTFTSETSAADAMAQTFGCGLNVSFYGVEEMLESCVTEQQVWCQKTGGYNDHEARMSG